MIFPINFSSDSAPCIIFVATDKRHSFCSRWEFMEQILQQRVACLNLASVWPGKFRKTLQTRQSSRIVKRWFARISSHTRTTQLSVLLVVGLPDRGLSSTESRPSLNLLCDSKMRGRLKHCSPKAVLNISNVSAPFLPSFTQNLMHTHCFALPTSCTARTITRCRYTTLFNQSSQRLRGTLGPSLVPGRAGFLGHHPANRGVPKCTHSWVKKSVSELVDHTLYSQNYIRLKKKSYFCVLYLPLTIL